MAQPGEASSEGIISRVRSGVQTGRDLAERTLAWRVWERMLEIEFIDRSVALAGKAFVSFFPLVIVVAAFVPEDVRSAIFTSLTSRLGIEGAALRTARQAFASSDDVRRATGFLGLVLTFFFASSFTTALQRVYLRAWRRPHQRAVGVYARGAVWLATMLLFMAITGALREGAGDGALTVPFALVMLGFVSVLWWFTAWLMLMGQVRWRVLLPSGVFTGIAIGVYTISANVWMDNVVERNQEQFGFFGVALALVTWFSGAAICILIGACAGPVLAEDDGAVGRLVRGGRDGVLVDGAVPSLPAPDGGLRLRDAFRQADDDAP